MGNTYEESLSYEKEEKLQKALNSGLIAQNQVEFTLQMLRELLVVINSERAGMISTERIRVWLKSVIDGLSDIQNDRV